MMDIRKRIADRAKIAREQLGLLQENVANEIGIARQTLSRLENAETSIDSELLAKLSELYRRPISYFYEDRSNNEINIALRADDPDLLESHLKNSLLDKMVAYADLEAAAGENLSHGLPPTDPITKSDEGSLRLVKQIAEEERDRLGAGRIASISDPVGTLEAISVRVIPFKYKPHEEDNHLLSGFSAYSDNLGAAIFVNEHPDISIERQVFTIAHEYAHLVFHRGGYNTPSQKYKTKGRNTSPEEKVANYFAGNFLVPESALLRYKPQSKNINPSDINLLKRKLRVSYGAMLTRLDQEKLISKKNVGWLWSVWKAKGWDTNEPNPITEPLDYKQRLVALSRRAFESNEASLSFLGDILELPRKEMASLAKHWEEESQINALH